MSITGTLLLALVLIIGGTIGVCTMDRVASSIHREYLKGLERPTHKGYLKDLERLRKRHDHHDT